MEVAQVVPGVQDGLDQVVLLDVHVEGVQQHLGVGALQPLDEGHALGGGVEQVLLEAVDHLAAVEDAVVLRHFHQLLHGVHRQVLLAALLVHGDAVVGHGLPAGVGHTVEHGGTHLGHALQDAGDMADAGLPHRRVVAGQIVLGLQADGVGDLQAVVVGAGLQLPQLGVIVVGPLGGGHLADVKAQPGLLFHQGDVLDLVPVVAPEAIVHPNGIHAAPPSRLSRPGPPGSSPQRVWRSR